MSGSAATRCHPEHGPHHARGLCVACYCRQRRLERRAQRPPHRGQHTVALVTRAERIKRELEAAGGYATHPPTWEGVAQYLGVKPATLDRYRYRAREYLAREAS